MERWFVVQKYYENGNQSGIVKSYNQLTDEEKEIFEKNEYKKYDEYELKVDEFSSYEHARDFKRGM